MTLSEMKQDAINQAKLFGVPGCTPSIEPAFYEIVARHQMAKIRANATAYVYGDVIQLPTRNEHRYRCIEGGTSASAEPTFPKCDGDQIVDGTVRWCEDGGDYANVYDVRAICHDAWMAKAAASSNLVSQSQGRSRVEASNLAEQCKARARDFAPLEMG